MTRPDILLRVVHPWHLGGVIMTSLIFSGVIIGGFWYKKEAVQSILSYPNHAIIAGTRYTTEIADSEAEKQQGLSGREALCQKCALLFIFSHVAEQGFWMHGMRFPLDIIWLVDDRVVHIEREISETSEVIFRPNISANRVIEVNAGSASRLQVGDRVRYER